ncbi:MAG: alpha/beta fold hydrolase, partial [Anaerolineae bacterium]|nr:alpha/beta fold hydrolase [Anaerolineae bacterium]
MAVEVIMPKWGLSMQKGLIGQWLKQEGDEVQAGEEIVEIETEKMTNVVESPTTGILARIVHPAGVEVPVTHVIAVITAPGEAVPEISGPSIAPADQAEAQATAEVKAAPAKRAQNDVEIRAMPVARKLAKEHGLDLSTISGTGPKGAISKKDVEQALAAKSEPVQPGQIRAMPVARRMAKEHGLDLSTVQGTGPNGAITKADVEQALKTSAESKVRPLQKVSFYSEGHRLAGLLYSPEDAQAGQSYPAVVLCVGYTYIKEMVMPDIAKVLNQAGYVALTFDYRGFGESEGPRSRLIPSEQVNDIRAALTFVANQAHVDDERLAVLGISLGGSNAVTVGAIDDRVGAVIAIEPMGDGERWLRSLRRYSEWMDLEAQLAADRVARVLTGQSGRVDPLYITLPDPASKAFLAAVLKEFPQVQVEVPLETAEALIEYSPEGLVDQIGPSPMLLIHGKEDRLVPMSESMSLFALASE